MQEQISAASHGTTKKHSRLRRILLWTAAFFLLLAICGVTAVEVALHRAEPTLRVRVVDTLSTRFDSRVELDRFHVYFLDGFEVSGGGLRIYPKQIDTERPLFAVDEFSFRTDWHGLLATPMHVGLVKLTGLAIHLPPKTARQNLPKLDASRSNGKIQILVDKLQIDQASLVLGTDNPDKTPLTFNLRRLELQSIGPSQPMKFHAMLTNPRPVGDIDSTGYFGPFDAHKPGDSPVGGDYSFTHADLSTLKGIGGILSSKGHYAGTLANITVDGETDTPDFKVDTGGHPMPLHTAFHAIVDGMNGDTHLRPVNAQLAHSHIVAVGDIVRAPQGGHNITLDVTVDPARLEDLLRLGVKTDPPIMRGAVKLQTDLSLPPGHVSVTEKLRLKGQFFVQNAVFTNERVQAKVDELSLRGQGRPEEAKEINKDRPEAIESQLQGQFELANRKLTFNDLQYNVPGANIAMTGVYTLDGNQVDFHGTARLKAKVSQLITGWKSILLQLADPLFAKNGAGTEVPISVTGTRSAPEFRLDFNRLKLGKIGHQDNSQDSAPRDRPKNSSSPQ